MPLLKCGQGKNTYGIDKLQIVCYNYGMGEPKIVRDGDSVGPNIVALMIEWGVNCCNVRSCTEMPTTIIRQDGRTFGLCETHFTEASQEGGAVLNLVWESDWKVQCGARERI